VATTADSTLPDDPRFGKRGKQSCQDTGPHTKKRMETFDSEVATETKRFIQDKTRAGQPWFLWFGNGRHELLRRAQTYDLITLEPPPPSPAGVVNLYSRDFYERCRAQLASGGSSHTPPVARPREAVSGASAACAPHLARSAV